MRDTLLSFKLQTLRILSAFATPRVAGNIAMIHIGRSGSTVLGDLLNQHPDIYWAGEFMWPLMRKWSRHENYRDGQKLIARDAIDVLRERMLPAMGRHFGFEIKPFHFRHMEYTPESFLDRVEQSGMTRYIILERKNRLRKIISSLIAHQNKNFHRKDGDGKASLTRIRINTDLINIQHEEKSLIQYLHDYEKQLDDFSSLLADRQFLRLAYEDDIMNDPLLAYHKVCDFLGFEHAPVKVKYAKMNPYPVAEIVENIDEVANVLRDTPYHWMVDD